MTEPAVDVVLLAPVLLDEYRSMKSWLGTLPLDVVRYMLQPMVFAHAGQSLTIDDDAGVYRIWPPYGKLYCNTKCDQLLALPDDSLALCYNVCNVGGVNVVDRDGHRLYSVATEMDQRVVGACVTPQGHVAMLIQYDSYWRLTVHPPPLLDIAQPPVLVAAGSVRSMYSVQAIAVDRLGNYYLHFAHYNLIKVLSPSGAVLCDMRREFGAEGVRYMVVCGDRLVLLHYGNRLVSCLLDGTPVCETTCGPMMVNSGQVKEVENMVGCAGDDLLLVVRGRDGDNRKCRFLVVFDARTLVQRLVLTLQHIGHAACIDRRGRVVVSGDTANKLAEIY